MNREVFRLHRPFGVDKGIVLLRFLLRRVINKPDCTDLPACVRRFAVEEDISRLFRRLVFRFQHPDPGLPVGAPLPHPDKRPVKGFQRVGEALRLHPEVLFRRLEIQVKESRQIGPAAFQIPGKQRQRIPVHQNEAVGQPPPHLFPHLPDAGGILQLFRRDGESFYLPLRQQRRADKALIPVFRPIVGAVEGREGIDAPFIPDAPADEGRALHSSTLLPFFADAV